MIPEREHGPEKGLSADKVKCDSIPKDSRNGQSYHNELKATLAIVMAKTGHINCSTFFRKCPQIRILVDKLNQRTVALSVNISVCSEHRVTSCNSNSSGRQVLGEECQISLLSYSIV